MRPLTVEDVLLFIDRVRLDPEKRQALTFGHDLLMLAAQEGLISNSADLGFLAPRMLEARDIGLLKWRQADHDHSGYDLMNAREFLVTESGMRHARELKGFPRFLLVVKELDVLLDDLGWKSVLEEFDAAENQFRAKHWPDAVAHYYAAVESALKYRLDLAGISYADGSALRDLSKRAAAESLFPTNYQQLFGYLDSIRSPRSHGRGNRPHQVEVGPTEALLMCNHARNLIQFLAQRLTQP